MINRYIENSLIELAITAAQKAGEAIMEVYQTNFSVELKNDRSPLTTADMRSHRIITDWLSQAVKNIPVLSEEGKSIPYATRKKWDNFWIIDPLDGTKEFIKKNGEFTVNIALVIKNKPVFGVIGQPAKKIIYYAHEDLGSFKIENNTEKKLPFQNRPDKLKLAASRSHLSQETEKFIDLVKKKYGEIEYISKGSALKFCLIAEGKADIYPRFSPTMEWDTAAGQIILEAAGGTVSVLKKNKSLEYNKKNLVNPWFLACSNRINVNNLLE